MLSSQRLDGLMKGDQAKCSVLPPIQSSGKPIPCLTCHGSVADAHATLASRSVVRPEADSVSTRSRLCINSKQTVYQLEADCVSTRSRLWFYPKYVSPTAIHAWHHGAPEPGELLSGPMKVSVSFAMTVYCQKLYRPEW